MTIKKLKGTTKRFKITTMKYKNDHKLSKIPQKTIFKQPQATKPHNWNTKRPPWENDHHWTRSQRRSKTPVVTEYVHEQGFLYGPCTVPTFSYWRLRHLKVRKLQKMRFRKTRKLRKSKPSSTFKHLNMTIYRRWFNHGFSKTCHLLC